MTNENNVNLGNLLEREAVKELLKILMEEITNSIPTIINEIPVEIGTEEEFPEELKGTIPDAFAVFKAIKKANHIFLRFIKSEEGKTFEEMMEDKTPEEMCFYVFKDSSTDKMFDLFFYDSQQGKYVNIGSTNLGDVELDTDKFWSKEELNLDEILANYWNKTELDITAMLDNYVKKSDLNLEDYVRKDEIGYISAEDVREMWSDIKAENV